MSKIAGIFVENILFNDEHGIYEEVDGRLGKHNAYFRRDLAPGSMEWGCDGSGNNHHSIIYICPCGCGMVGHVSVNKTKEQGAWQWDGNTEKPTLTPSILHTSGCKWHGYLTAGIWESC